MTTNRPQVQTQRDHPHSRRKFTMTVSNVISVELPSNANCGYGKGCGSVEANNRCVELLLFPTQSAFPLVCVVNIVNAEPTSHAI